MAKSTSKHRYIDTSFWDDEFVSELDPSEKLLYIYLLTNPLTNIAGIYKLSNRRICFDTGFNVTTVDYIFQKFEKSKKVFRCGEYVILKSWCNHQSWTTSDNIKTGIETCLLETPTDILICAYKNGFTFDLLPILQKLGVKTDTLSTESTGYTEGIDTLSRAIEGGDTRSNYLNSNLNLNSNSNLNTHINSENENSNKQKETQIFENKENVCVESDSLPENNNSVSDQQKYYAKLVFDIWEKADLPRPKTGYITFLMRDFKLALIELQKQHLHSDDVIKACENYATVINMSRKGQSWWSSKSTFDNFVKPGIISRFLPDYFDIENFREKSDKKGSAISRSNEYSNVEIDF